MSTKLIQTKDYLLLIDEEAEIKNEYYVLSLINKPVIIDIVTESDDEAINGKLIKWTNRKHCAKIIAYYPLTKEAKELDLPLLPNPEENNIEELASLSFENQCILPFSKEEKELFVIARTIYKQGYRNSHRVAKFKQFSLEDIRNAISFGIGIEIHNLSQSTRQIEIEKFIQSLSTQQLPKEFVGWLSKKKCPYDFTSRCTIDRCDCEFDFETITNSEGKEEIQGTYKY